MQIERVRAYPGTGCAAPTEGGWRGGVGGGNSCLRKELEEKGETVRLGGGSGGGGPGS